MDSPQVAGEDTHARRAAEADPPRSTSFMPHEHSQERRKALIGRLRPVSQNRAPSPSTVTSRGSYTVTLPCNPRDSYALPCLAFGVAVQDALFAGKPSNHVK